MIALKALLSGIGAIRVRYVRLLGAVFFVELSASAIVISYRHERVGRVGHHLLSAQYDFCASLLAVRCRLVCHRLRDRVLVASPRHCSVTEEPMKISQLMEELEGISQMDR